MITRRTLFRGTAGTLAGAMLTRPLHAQAHGAVIAFQELPTARDERLHMLITTAVDAAKSAGAKYADARLTFSQQMEIQGTGVEEKRRAFMQNRRETMAFGVRAQYEGYWGFASSPVWTKEEAARLGRMAVDSAKANVLGKARDVEMAPNPDAMSGDWSMPITDDPFAMDSDEIYDYLVGLIAYLEMLPEDLRLGGVKQYGANANFFRQQKAFGSTDGQFVTQRVYRTGGDVGMNVFDSQENKGAVAGGRLSQFNTAGAGRGFELLRDPHIREWVRQLYEKLAEERLLPVIPVDVGRFQTLIHPGGVASILKQSVGVATEIDRVMGYEANTTGTSYIIDPDESLGSLKIGAPTMQVTATRSLPGGIGHVKWDDEGVEVKDFTLIQNGVLTNLQTNREGSAWMKGYLAKTGQPIRSNGCAYAIDATDPQAVHPADLLLHPDPARDTTLTQLREQMEKGVEFEMAGLVSLDFQQSTGMMNGSAFLIKNGKRVARIAGPAMLFRTAELWGNLQAVGGPSSVRHVGTADAKNNLFKQSYSSVNAPPALFKEMSIINPTQKA